MSDDTLYGIIKFFRERDKLDYLLDGGFYCNTPETYRLSNDEGVSDHYESCAHSYRISRGDPATSISFNGDEIDGIESLTIHVNKITDMYLHCWYALKLPKGFDEDDIRQLCDGINRMRKEFGSDYALISAENIDHVANILSKNTSFDVHHGNVEYSDEKMNWSPICKPSQYSYQNEYRFLIGKCQHTDTDPLIIRCSENIREFVGHNAELKIEDANSKEVLMTLSPSECKCFI